MIIRLIIIEIISRILPYKIEFPYFKNGTSPERNHAFSLWPVAFFMKTDGEENYNGHQNLEVEMKFMEKVFILVDGKF